MTLVLPIAVIGRNLAASMMSVTIVQISNAATSTEIRYLDVPVTVPQVMSAMAEEDQAIASKTRFVQLAIIPLRL